MGLVAPCWVGFSRIRGQIVVSCTVYSLPLRHQGSLINFFFSENLVTSQYYLFVFILQFIHSVLSNSLSSMNCSTPGFPVHHQLPELVQTCVHLVREAIQSSQPLSSPSLPGINLFEHQGLFQWVSFSHQVAKVLEFQLQHQSFQWMFRTDFL